jgi:hypothetical protein
MLQTTIGCDHLDNYLECSYCKPSVTFGSHLSPSPEVQHSRWQKIIEGKGQEVIDELS